MTLSIEDFRQKLIPTARAYKWAVAFMDYENGQFFPCQVLNDTAAVFSNSQIEYGPWKFDYPESCATGNVDLTIFELNEYKIRKWITEWMNSITDSKTWGVGLLGNVGVTKQLNIEFLGIDNSIKYSKSVLVIPDGECSYEMSSDKNSQVTVSLSLIVVGT